ncbi:MAG: FeoA family protein [Candidatus Methanomethylophilaceae archaeon]|nr:FeoA family protein [Candidatus Methanomethylophilaceae archaeon]NLF33538.1 ferrous iron transport protein A [Thermoplasmatales archaeon]
MDQTCFSSCGCCRGCGGVSPLGAPAEPAAGGIPLAVAKDGDTGRIVRIAGRCEVRRFLSDLGFVIGADVSVVNTISGNLLLDVRGTRIAMDRTMASKVFIMPEGS